MFKKQRIECENCNRNHARKSYKEKTNKRHKRTRQPTLYHRGITKRPMIPPRRLGRVQCKTEEYFRPQAVAVVTDWRGLEAVLFQPAVSRKRQREKILQVELSCRVIPRSRKVGTQGAGSHARQKRRTRRGRWRPPKSLTGWSVFLDSPKFTVAFWVLLIKFGSDEILLYFGRNTISDTISNIYRFPVATYRQGLYGCFSVVRDSQLRFDQDLTRCFIAQNDLFRNLWLGSLRVNDHVCNLDRIVIVRAIERKCRSYIYTYNFVRRIIFARIFQCIFVHVMHFVSSVINLSPVNRQPEIYRRYHLNVTLKLCAASAKLDITPTDATTFGIPKPLRHRARFSALSCGAL